MLAWSRPIKSPFVVLQELDGSNDAADLVGAHGFERRPVQKFDAAGGEVIEAGHAVPRCQTSTGPITAYEAGRARDECSQDVNP
jgi:hypothetical protein